MLGKFVRDALITVPNPITPFVEGDFWRIGRLSFPMTLKLDLDILESIVHLLIFHPFVFHIPSEDRQIRDEEVLDPPFLSHRHEIFS